VRDGERTYVSRSTRGVARWLCSNERRARPRAIARALDRLTMARVDFVSQPIFET
jgi:hypothetical protein